MTKIKHKTRKTAAKRFKITSTGKVLRRVQGMRHLRRKKSKKQQRRAAIPVVVPTKFAKKIKQMLGLA